MKPVRLMIVLLCGLLALASLVAFMSFSSPARGSAINSSTIQVSTLADELNNDNDCSLREALRAANLDQAIDACPAGDGDDTILIPTGIYTLTRAGKNEDAGVTGDLDILESVSIQGLGAANTIIDGGDLDRVFHNVSGQKVSFLRLSIRNGRAEDPTTYGGGGILNTGGELRMIECALAGNEALSGTGGGVDNYKNLVIQSSTFMTNTTGSSGGGIASGRATSLYLYDSTFFGNNASVSGGAIDFSENAFIQNITFYSNTSNSGGAIFSDGTANIVNSTLVNNSNGIECNGCSLQLLNTLLVNNLGIDNCGGSNLPNSKGHNLESGDSCGLTEVGDQKNVSDAMLGPLENHGGATQTFSLLEGSPAIDNGDNLDCSSSDQRGATRPVDGNGDFLARCDVGSYELFGLNPVLVYLPLIQR